MAYLHKAEHFMDRELALVSRGFGGKRAALVRSFEPACTQPSLKRSVDVRLARSGPAEQTVHPTTSLRVLDLRLVVDHAKVQAHGLLAVELRMRYEF